MTLQLKSKAVPVKTGTQVDATILASASEGDDEARWVKHNGKRAVHGFKAHVGADAPTALVEELSVTPTNVRQALTPYLAIPVRCSLTAPIAAITFTMPSAPKPAYPGSSPGMWGHNEEKTLRKLHAWNQPIHRVRRRIEKIFGTWKRCYGLRRLRWRGLAKAAVHVHLTAIAYIPKRTMNILAAHA